VPIISGDGGGFSGGTIADAVTIASPDNETQLTINAPVGASADVLMIHADAADPTNTRHYVDSHGNLHIESGGTFQEAAITLVDNTAGNPGQINIDTFSGLGLSPEGSSNPVLNITPRAAHTGRLVKITDDQAVETLVVSVGGYLLIKTHAAPADAALAAGECALWFDQTNGAAKLMVKAKQADGAVKTAAVALA
jgi:hypothetical protein